MAYCIPDEDFHGESLPDAAHRSFLRFSSPEKLSLTSEHFCFVCSGLLRKPSHKIMHSFRAKSNVEVSFLTAVLLVFDNNLGRHRRRDAQGEETTMLEKNSSAAIAVLIGERFLHQT